ncbi:olfactory receptor 7A10-like [Tachyglossus aculeatus]|uniref:olfactory receptor 7A10-like n=1 Tax=Tachyglossus aculeatus TaxID=9261 RepID=UPI0018F4BDA8|nr:olfactory receptor 7A10-like [Tachyglossus aculeatus]
MEKGNQTSVPIFLLLGLFDWVEQRQLFGLFLWMYLLGVLGNLLIALAVSSDPHMHTPMYFFLSNLSLSDACLLSTTIPKMLANLLTQDKSISYDGCLAQMFFFLLFVGLDDFLLTSMAYDRYVAICHPLHYTTIMNPRLCALLVAGSWSVSSLDSLIHTLLVVPLSFCTDNEILHFFCEPNRVRKLSCTDTLINDVVLYVVAVVLAIFPFVGIVFSYTRIITTLLRVPSAKGRYKAFNTCCSHLLGVSLFYGTGCGVYLSPISTQASQKGSIASVMYTVVTPMLNPFIYSLRNKDMKEALRNVFRGKTVFMQRL